MRSGSEGGLKHTLFLNGGMALTVKNNPAFSLKLEKGGLSGSVSEI